MKQRSWGSFDALSKLFQLLQNSWPISALDTPVPCLLGTRRPSPTMVLPNRFVGYSGN